MSTRAFFRVAIWVVALASVSASVAAQSTTGTIQGTVKDEQQGLVPGATVTVRHVETNATRTAVSTEQGQFRISNLPSGTYEVAVELPGFSKYVRTGVSLAINQDAVLDVTLRPAGVTETVTVQADSPVLNTTTAEVGVRFDTKRIAELPVSPPPGAVGGFRDIYSLALSAPGVSQLGTGQSNFSLGQNYSSNGMRLRSNNFMIDGQDSNDPGVSGRVQPINNTDIVSEIRLITNQFAAEYGRAAGSVMNVITKSGTNDLHGTAFWFHNDDVLNARSNLDKAARLDDAPFRIEKQYGGTGGGPVLRDKAFFFGSYQRWTDEALGSGQTINGVPTEAGRGVLQSAPGDLPQVAALLRFLPAAQAPLGRLVSFTRGGQTFNVPIGSLTGSANQIRSNHQFMTRGDVILNPNHTLSGRYLFTDDYTEGVNAQVTPAGLTTVNPVRSQAANLWVTSVLGGNLTNEFRVAYQRYATETNAQDPSSQEIPSIEISELGLTGFNAGPTRTAIGLAVNLPQFRFNNAYQIQDTLAYLRGRHALKFGVDIRRNEVKSFFVPTIRGLLGYATLQNFIDDVAERANINRPLPGGQAINYYNWDDVYLFVQDEWKVGSDLTLTMGVRYETPGDSIASLVKLNESIVTAANGNEVFRITPVPERDLNNFQPRVGFNWHPQTDPGGMLGWLTGGNKLVVRGGYSRTNDYGFININLNIASAFPFVAAINRPNLASAFTQLPLSQPTGDPRFFTRTIVSEDYRAPSADQFSLELQREVSQNLVARIGYVGTRGNDLFQTLDGNPVIPFTPNPNSPVRQDPTRGVIRERSNTAESVYHSLQTGLDKRFSNGLSAGMNYTWSKYIDTASEIFNPSSGEVAVSQDSYNRDADRAVSTYDRTHRFAGNFVYELPIYREQVGVIGHVLGGWQLSSSFTFQSGAPFTALNGADPTGALAGISGLVGVAIRPNINTDLDLSNMTIPEIIAAGGRNLFRQLCGAPSPTCAGERVGNLGRNTLRADGINNVDIGIIKNTRVVPGQTLQFRIELFNAFNSRDFGIPEGRVNNQNFLNQWGTNGGNRRIWLAVRYIF